MSSPPSSPSPSPPPCPPFRSDDFWTCPSMAGPDGPLLNLLENLKPLTAVEAPKIESGMKVTDLPNDILTNLPHYLDCLDDWYAVIRTCRRFYHACATTKATFPAFFARRFTKGSLPVHRDLLMAGSSRQVADWAVKSEKNRRELWDAINMEGDEGLLKLGVEIARWNVDEVRAIQEAHVKMIEPLCKAIEVESGRTHESHCSSSQRFDDRDDLKCGLCTRMDQVRASLYSFVIYCNLFHADIEESYGQLPLNVGLLGSAFRGHWMDNRMGEFQINGRDISWSQLDFMGDSRRRLRVYFRAQPDLKDIWKAEETRRFKLFFRIMSHQGLDTLRFLLPDGVLAKDIASNICSKIWELPLEQVSNKKVWDSRDLPTRDQIGWHSMECDEEEHRRQSSYT